MIVEGQMPVMAKIENSTGVTYINQCTMLQPVSHMPIKISLAVKINMILRMIGMTLAPFCLLKVNGWVCRYHIERIVK